MLLLAGSKDTTVDPANSTRLAAAIRARGGAVTATIVPGKSHVGLLTSMLPPPGGRSQTLDAVTSSSSTPPRPRRSGTRRDPSDAHHRRDPRAGAGDDRRLGHSARHRKLRLDRCGLESRDRRCRGGLCAGSDRRLFANPPRRPGGGAGGSVEPQARRPHPDADGRQHGGGPALRPVPQGMGRDIPDQALPVPDDPGRSRRDPGDLGPRRRAQSGAGPRLDRRSRGSRPARGDRGGRGGGRAAAPVQGLRSEPRARSAMSACGRGRVTPTTSSSGSAGWPIP